MIWARSPTNFDSWEAELQFRVTGRGRIGADGLAFWYTATKGFEGPVSSMYPMMQMLGFFSVPAPKHDQHCLQCTLFLL